MDFKIERPEPDSPFAELRLIGRLDSETASVLDEQLEQFMGQESQGLVLDLRDLSYLSSAGIRSLFMAQSLCGEKGGKLWVLAPQPAVLKVLDMVRILAPGTIVETREEILAG